MAAAKASSTTTVASLAKIISDLIDGSRKTQREIEASIGYLRPNVLSMIKRGQMPLPLNKVVLLAEAVGVDPRYLLGIVLPAKYPDVHRALIEIIGDVTTENELDFVRRLRVKAKGANVRYSDEAVNAAVDLRP